MGKGFTLVELAIVLVIIGLLIGGVLAGRELIEQSTLRKIKAEIDDFARAEISFTLKYKCYAGDCKNATAFFGTAANCNDISGAGTCNGNGNNLVNSADDSTPPTSYEYFQRYDHLAEAGLITGSYTGVPGIISGWDAIPNQNTLAGHIANSCIVSGRRLSTPSISNGNRFDGRYGYGIVYGARLNSTLCYGPMISPNQMRSFDFKFDDGNATYGKVMPFKSTWNSNCTTSDNMGASYNISFTDPACSINFLDMITP